MEILIIIGVLVAYFLPYIVAHNRKHKSVTAIGLTNLLLGWTGAFWLFALIWSCTGNVHEPAK